MNIESRLKVLESGLPKYISFTDSNGKLKNLDILHFIIYLSTWIAAEQSGGNPESTIPQREREGVIRQINALPGEVKGTVMKDIVAYLSK